MYILTWIEGNSTNCTFESCDIEPCARDCDDDGVFEDGNCELNVFDIFAILDVLEGYIACCDGQALGGMAGMSAGYSGDGTAELMLEVREVGAPGFVTYEVDVYASEFVDLRAYEVALDVNGAGGLEVQRVYIDTMRPDYVFAGLESYSGVDVVGGRIVTVSMDSGVASTSAAYLGTFVLCATEDARGTFKVLPRAGDATILLDSFGQQVKVLNAAEATVSLP